MRPGEDVRFGTKNSIWSFFGGKDLEKVGKEDVEYSRGVGAVGCARSLYFPCTRTLDAVACGNKPTVGKEEKRPGIPSLQKRAHIFLSISRARRSPELLAHKLGPAVPSLFVVSLSSTDVLHQSQT